MIVAALLGAQAGERLVWPKADGFVVAHQQDNGRTSIEEQVPKGETVEQWTRMITTLTFAGPLDPAGFADRMAGLWSQSCPGAKAGAPVSGARGVDIRIDCPLNPQTGKPETMFQRSVAGESKLYVLQVAFRLTPTKDQAAWAMAQLDRATLCRLDSVEAACR
ncbi:hypothetical protein LZK98_04125 [Sphingomonas cannabina]|uniref:hypothetical protein n=1 Tax=Sphingomonas cannabina TaxID=2899123 RepID=UPI001F1F6F55|nr:hypothetical protein [Sphingomonas cannabina]UIJ46146.1 hypothetical protein LZK98_04125 [Sphingomonas cannabina]